MGNARCNMLRKQRSHLEPQYASGEESSTDDKKLKICLDKNPSWQEEEEK